MSDVWSRLAPWYDELVESGRGRLHAIAVDALLALLPPVDGAAVLDVGCGQGLAARAVADAGPARVVGTDAAEGMLALARTRSPPEIEFVHDDAQRLTAFGDASFDGAVCQLALMDIPDLGAALRSIHRVLAPNGWFAFVISHPAFLAPGAETREDGRWIPRYLEQEFWKTGNPEGVRGRAGNFHRPLSTYLNALAAAGFGIEATREPAHPEISALPVFFAARCRRS